MALDGDTPRGQDGRWAENDADPILSTPLGLAIDPEDPDEAPMNRVVSLQLGAEELGGNGRLGVMTGITGTGKSILQRTLVNGLAYRYSPQRVNFILASCFTWRPGVCPLADLSRHPHVLHVSRLIGFDYRGGFGQVDWDGDVFWDAVNREVERREKIIRDGYSDMADYRRRSGPMPDLVIIIDDLESLPLWQPEMVTKLNSLIRRSANLGVYCVLSSIIINQDYLRSIKDEIGYGVTFGSYGASEMEFIAPREVENLTPSTGVGFFQTSRGEVEKVKVFEGVGGGS
ncbi:FtsK/SpoIIIE domain-containing protein [Gordonia malaquae]|uniref:FtsK/SpoIIIE domain-containing protein n=1 Tax=Gordonia malaquae TaxID=410332 RepID=UPI003017B4A5